MRASSMLLLTGLSLAACVPSGYYDSNGTYHASGASDVSRTNSPRNNQPVPGAYHDDYQDRSDTYRDDTYRSDAAPVDTMHNVTRTDTTYDANTNRPVRTDIYTSGRVDVPTTTTVIYERPGAYDYNGYYISSDSGPEIPGRYFPPQGMCRIWFTDRANSEQPPVESCHGIDHRVPAGAYVVYGG